MSIEVLALLLIAFFLFLLVIVLFAILLKIKDRFSYPHHKKKKNANTVFSDFPIQDCYEKVKHDMFWLDYVYRKVDDFDGDYVKSKNIIYYMTEDGKTRAICLDDPYFEKYKFAITISQAKELLKEEQISGCLLTSPTKNVSFTSKILITEWQKIKDPVSEILIPRKYSLDFKNQ